MDRCRQSGYGAGWAAVVVLLLGLTGRGLAAAVDVERDVRGQIKVRGAQYAAELDAQGNMRSLVVQGVELLNWKPDEKPARRGIGFPKPEPAPEVKLDAVTVRIVNGPVQVEYAFAPDGFEVRTQGASLEWHLSAQPNALYITKNGNTVRGQKGGLGDVHKIVIGPATLGLSESFHRVNDKLFPSIYARGGKPAEAYKYRVTIGVPVEPTELLSGLDVAAEGFGPFVVPQYAPGKQPSFVFTLTNLGKTELAGELRWKVVDHYYQGKVLAEGKEAVVLKPEQTVKPGIKPKAPSPGFYWVSGELMVGDKAVRSVEMGWVYAPTEYQPALTRPADFRAFWDAKVAAMRALPFDAKLTENKDRSTPEGIWYDLEITVAPGKRLTGMFTTPRQPGKYIGQFSEIRGEVSEKQYSRWKPVSGKAVFVGLPWPDVADYRRWVSRDDNNMLDCYLVALRMADFLRSRPEVDKLILRGASRSGALALVTAVLDPTRILYVDAHVPTSMGVSWSDKIYRGWGARPGNLKDDVWNAMAPYMDPLNFAPDIQVPFIIDGGIFDDLAPPPGILAFHNHAVKAPWKRVSIEKGGHGFFPPTFRQNALQEVRKRVGLGDENPQGNSPAAP